MVGSPLVWTTDLLPPSGAGLRSWPFELLTLFEGNPSRSISVLTVEFVDCYVCGFAGRMVL